MSTDPLAVAITRLQEAEYQLLHLANADKDEKRKAMVNDLAQSIRKACAIVDDLYLTHTEDTLFKVHKALTENGLSEQSATDAISAMLTNGVLFRERRSNA